MARQPVPRFDKWIRAWIVQCGGKKHYLGRDYADAMAKFARIVQGGGITTPESVAEAVDQWLNVHGGGDWREGMLGSWVAFAGPSPLSELTDDHLIGYGDHLRRIGNGPQTIIHKIRFAKRVLTWCERREHIGRVPDMPKLEKPIRRPRHYEPDELAKGFETLPKHARRVLLFILATGCRPSEAIRLRWEQVDRKRGLVEIADHKTANSRGEPRRIALTPAALEVLDDVPTKRGFVFLSRLGTPYTPKGLRSILLRRGLTSVYALRHTFAQSALDQGVSLDEVARLLGHVGLGTVDVYARIRQERLRAVASTLVSPLPPPPSDESDPDPPPAKPKRRPKTSKRRPRRSSSGPPRRDAGP